MPPGFTKIYAEGLNKTALMQVVEGKDGDLITPGKVIIAPGGKQMRVMRSGANYMVKCVEGEKVSGHCPSVDVLFNSVAKNVGANAIGTILTGMGADGAEGMLAMKKAGAFNISQDEKSCVVYGMPKVAVEMGGVDQILSLDSIPGGLMEALKKK